jgi:CBS domain-containing protein
MQIKEIMTHKVEMVNASDSVTDAARKMKTLNVGVLPVRDGNKLVGIITDRDIVIRAMAESDQSGRMSVKEAMTADITYCFSEDTIEDAAHIMSEKKVRRLVVLDSSNKPTGIVSLGDIAVKPKAEQLAGHTLEVVSEPCSPSR